MALQFEQAVYSDLNALTPGQNPLVKDVAAVQQSIQALLATPVGSRLFEPEVGALLDDNLFELINDETAVRLRNIIVDAIDRWEPRVEIQYAGTNVVPIPHENKYDITIVFRIIGVDAQDFEISGAIRVS